MSPRPGGAPVSATPVREEEARATLARLLASESFANSPRLSRFLQWTVEAVLEGRTESLKEFALGQDVFDRGPDYDPRSDSIVRVEAVRLRRKLAAYYDGPGVDDPVIVSCPPGSYAPRFDRRTSFQPPSEVTALDLDPDTVAVLPFVNLSSDPEQALFCNGAAEEIILELASVPGLKVLGLTTALALQDCSDGFMSMCQRLGVGTLVEGSVRKSGNQIRVGARTVDVATGQTVWSRSFDREVDDIFAIQDEIAQEVAAALQAPSRPVPAIPVGGAGVEAYMQYLRGRQAWDDGTPDRYLASVSHFQQAVALSPEFALPHSGLAAVYQWMALWGWMRPHEARKKSHASAQESLRIDPHSADSHVAWAAHLLRFEWTWKEAAAALDRAIELNPSCGLAYSVKANCAMAQSRIDEGFHCFERAVQLDPLSYRTNGALAIGCWLVGRYEDAERWFRVAQGLKPRAMLTQYFLARLYLSMGENAKAIEASRALAEQPYLLLSALGTAHASVGDTAEAREILRRLQGRAQSEYVDGAAIAAVQVGLGDVDGALSSLEAALAERSPMMAFLNVDPQFQMLHGEPRFQAMVSAVGLG
jgi:adenylate cyclase